MDQQLRDFYDREYLEGWYAPGVTAGEHPFFPQLQSFISEHELLEKRCLEVGCGRGAFQNVVADYTGVDISASVRPFIQKPFFRASATELPFPDGSFDAIWSYAVLEHVPEPEKALSEIRRVLVDGGLLLLAPAWQCRPWAAQGYPVRPYRDLGLRGRLIKASIPVRDSVLFRATYIMPRRLIELARYWTSQGPIRFRFRELRPNYEHFWMSDSDAVNSMDPFSAILWFHSRGDHCLNYRNWISKLAVRTGSLVVRVCKSRRMTIATDAEFPPGKSS